MSDPQEFKSLCKKVRNKEIGDRDLDREIYVTYVLGELKSQPVWDIIPNYSTVVEDALLLIPDQWASRGKLFWPGKETLFGARIVFSTLEDKKIKVKAYGNTEALTICLAAFNLYKKEKNNE